MSVSAEWVLPAWWEFREFEDDTFLLVRVDGVVLSSFKSEMGFWGWCVSEGGDPFLDHYGEDDALEEQDEEGNTRLLPVVREAAMRYPHPEEFIHEVDLVYSVEA